MWSRSDCRYGPRSPPTSTPSVQSSPSHCRSSTTLCSDSRVERSKSVSSMRRMNVPPWPRASSQLKSAVRALPTWSAPVGLGANLTRTDQRDCVRGNRLSSSDGVDAFVGLALDAHARAIDLQHARGDRRHRFDVTADLRLLEHDGDCDVADLESLRGDHLDGAREQVDARRVLPARIAVREMTADVALTDGAENRIGHRMAHDVGIGMPERADVRRDRHAAEDERPAGYEAMQVVAGAGAAGPRGQRLAIRELRDRFGDWQILRGGDLDVRRLTLDDLDRVPGALRQRRFVGHVVSERKRIGEDR